MAKPTKPSVAKKDEGTGFTLLEVMVAVAILALSLTAIFASQGGAIKVAHRARKTSVAALLARCKMNEIEQEIFEEGFPAIELGDTDGCCEDSEIEGFECEWIVRRIELPEPAGMDDEEGGLLPEEGAAGGAEGGEGAVDVEGILAGGAGMGGGSGDMLTEVAMSYAYPILKPVFEEQIRRARVRVKWTEGEREHDFDVVQYLVAEPSQLPQDDSLDDIQDPPP